MPICLFVKTDFIEKEKKGKCCLFVVKMLLVFDEVGSLKEHKEHNYT